MVHSASRWPGSWTARRRGCWPTRSTPPCSAPPGGVSIDAGGLTFLDSGGIRALLTCRKRVARAGRELVIVNPGPNVLQVLQITGLLEVFGVTGTPAVPDPTRPA